jgi:hypothetical protein
MIMLFLYDMKQYDLKIMRNKNNKDILKNFAFNNMPILDFNSVKFDMHFFVKYVCIGDYKIEFALVKSSYYICLKESIFVYKNKKPREVILRFVDAIIYTPRCTIDHFTQNYTNKNVSKREESFFSYEALNTDNYKKYLNRKDLFAQKDLYSSLTQSDMSNSDFEIYVQNYQ